MTREEAIEILKYNMEMCLFNPMTGEQKPMSKECEESAEAFKMAIEALEAQKDGEWKTGEWIDFSMSIKGVPTEACGECGEWSYGMGKNFCPNCGAEMRKEGDAK